MEMTKTNINRSQGSTWTFVLWMTLGGFISIGIIFFMGALLTCTVVGVLMTTQIFRLANYLLSGADNPVVPDYQADKVKNIIWAILIGWLLYLLHMLFGAIFYATYVGRGISKIWFDTAKLVLTPFGVEIKL